MRTEYILASLHFYLDKSLLFLSGVSGKMIRKYMKKMESFQPHFTRDQLPKTGDNSKDPKKGRIFEEKA